MCFGYLGSLLKTHNAFSGIKSVRGIMKKLPHSDRVVLLNIAALNVVYQIGFTKSNLQDINV